MFSRILVPLNGSRHAEQILVQAGAILRRKESEVILLCAVSGAPQASKEVFHGTEPREREAVEKYLGGVQTRLRASGVNIRSLIELGPPADVILRIADNENATMIAMSTHGRSGLARWALGSVAERVVRASKVPVLLARSFTSIAEGAVTQEVGKESTFKRILVPTDGSERSLAVLPFVKEFAESYGSEILMLSVAVPAMLSPLDVVDFGELEQVAPPHTSDCRAVASKFAEQGIQVRILSTTGDPASEIIDRCVSESSDLIVMTTHGRSGVSRWMLGSVSEKVLRGASTLLLLVRSQKEQ